MGKVQFETIFYPGKTYSNEGLSILTEQLRAVAAECFLEVPLYQALSGKRKEMERAIICLARDKDYNVIGFCSSLVLEVPTFGDVFHTGLTCVSPKARGLRLTHKLTSKILINYLLNESPLSPVWVSNCACVISSLGNAALYFEDIFPSPFNKAHATKAQLGIAEYISKNYRGPIAINSDAVFNPETFVFEGSVKDAVFEKDVRDARFHHRNPDITTFYKNYLDFSRGDEVLQIGKVSLLTFPKYLWSSSKRKSAFLVHSFQERLGY